MRLDRLAKSESRGALIPGWSRARGGGAGGAGPEGRGQLKETPLGKEPQTPNKSTAKAEAWNRGGSAQSSPDIVNEPNVE